MLWLHQKENKVMRRRYIIIIGASIISLFIAFLVLRFLATFSGSYHYAEWYLFEESKENLITNVTNLKNQNPKYRVMMPLDSVEYTDRYVNHYYSCSFYFFDRGVTLNCVIAGNDSVSRIGLVSIKKKYSDTARLLNKELHSKENAEFKELFETEILDKLGKWQHKSKGWSDYIK